MNDSTSPLANQGRFAPGQGIAGRFTVIRYIACGGMGEVYQVEDSHLQGVHVALKVIKPEIASDPGYARRFEQEVILARKVTHPNLCPIYDIARSQDPPPGFLFLTMKLLSGETLAARLLRPVPIQRVEAIAIFRQMIAGLSALHAAGIIHRDIKPGNVMLDYSGPALCLTIMDFGLARQHAPTGAQPTVVAGTPGFMAPEMVRGQPPSRATDYFALGVLLHQVFTGGGAPHIGVFSLEAEPSAALDIADVPSPLIHAVKEFLSTDPGRRMAAFEHVASVRWDEAGRPEPHTPGHRDPPPPIGPARLAVGPDTHSLGVPRPAGTASSAPQSIFTRRNFLWSAGAVAVAGSGAWAYESLRTHPRPPAMRVGIALPLGAAADDPSRLLGAPAVAPDGSAIVIALQTTAGPGLFIRRLDSDQLVRLEGTEYGDAPFWSPDSRNIAFFADGKLKRMSEQGGAAQVLCEANNSRGGSWGSRGTIVFGINLQGLYRVPEAGGIPAAVTQLDTSSGENSHRYPVFLPDGVRFLYFARADNAEKRGIYLDSLSHGQARRRVSLTNEQFAIGRDPQTQQYYLLTQQAHKIVAQRFDADSGKLDQNAVPLLDGGGTISVSDSGILVVRTVPPSSSGLVWRDRAGRDLGHLAMPGSECWTLDISPDDKTVAAVRHEGSTGQFTIWTVRLDQGLLELLSNSVHADQPVWTHDNTTVYYTDSREHKFLRRRITPRGPEELVWQLSSGVWVTDISATQRFALAHLPKADQGTQIAWTELEDGRPANWHPLPVPGTHVLFPTFSPDGNWIAFQSDQTGAMEVYVMDFPAGRVLRRISDKGGRTPRWRGDGKELFYIASDGSMTSTQISMTKQVAAAMPGPLFAANVISSEGEQPRYDVTSDGQRFLLVEQPAQAAISNIEMVLNWPSLLPA